MITDTTDRGIFGTTMRRRKSANVSTASPKLQLPGTAALQSMSIDELVEELTRYVAAKRRKTLEEIAEGRKAEDGSLRIPSMEAVALLGALGRAVGRPKLIDLRKVEDLRHLRSARGLAVLISGAVEGTLPC